MYVDRPTCYRKSYVCSFDIKGFAKSEDFNVRYTGLA